MHRMLIAILALISGLVALYLHLWKLGLAGSLACGSGHGCVVAQMSPYGWFLGVDVALIGTVGYSLIFLVALVGSQPRFESARWPSLALLALVVPALLFTIRLKYAEFVILRTFCPWCAESAIAITCCTVLAVLDWRRVRGSRAAA